MSIRRKQPKVLWLTQEFTPTSASLMVIFLVFLVYIQQDILIITGLQASGVIIDRLLQKCCFVWSEIVGPYSSGNFNDWPLKLKAGSKIWVVVIGIQQDIYIHISPWDALSQVHKAVTDFFPIIRIILRNAKPHSMSNRFKPAVNKRITFQVLLGPVLLSCNRESDARGKMRIP